MPCQGHTVQDHSDRTRGVQEVVPITAICQRGAKAIKPVQIPFDVIQSPEVKVRERKEDNTPDTITGSYTTDFNISRVHDIIVRRLNNEKNTVLPGLQTRLQKHQRQIKRAQSVVERKADLKEIDTLSHQIQEIESGSRLTTYQERVRDLLEAYRKLTPPSRCVVFDSNTEETSETLTDDDRDRLIVIDKFLNICRDYINIDVVRESLRKNVCEGCSKSLAGVTVDDDWLQQCPHCGLEKYVLSNMVIRDGTTSTRNEYNDITNFVKALHRYQGLQAPKFPSDMEARLDAYFMAHHRPPGSEIRKLPMTERGRRGDTDHKMLFTALAATGLSDFYDDANLIGSTYWGWSLPDVRHLEPLILDHYRATQEVYVRLPKTRSSSLGTQFRLYRHLVLVGYVCYLSEFKVSNSDSSVDEHEALWKAMCEGANRPDIYYIPMV